MTPDFESVQLDQSLRDFPTFQNVDQRLAILRQLAEYWHGPIEAGDGFAVEDLRGKTVPLPLRRWYQLAGRRDEILSGQNRLLTPTELAVDEEGRLTFYVENQGVYLWSTLPGGEDPPVSGMFDEIHPTWIKEDMSLSEFLVEACLFEAILRAQFGAAAGCASQTTLDRLRTELPLLPLASWRWPNYPSQFFSHEGAFAFVAPYEHRGEVAFSIWIGAKTSRPLSFLEGMVGDPEWEHVAL